MIKVNDMIIKSRSDVEQQFHRQMLEIYRRAKGECGYNAIRFYQMVEAQGGLQTAKTLLASKRIPDGWTSQWKASSCKNLGRLCSQM